MVAFNGTVAFAVAEFDFTATEADEISFCAGDIIRVIAKHNDDWWEGEVNGKTGVFPKNRCTETTDISGTDPGTEFDSGPILRTGDDMNIQNSVDIKREASPTGDAASQNARGLSTSGDWRQAVNADGQVYYYHVATKQTSWKPPDKMSPPLAMRTSPSQAISSEAAMSLHKPFGEAASQRHNDVLANSSAGTSHEESATVSLPIYASLAKEPHQQHQHNTHAPPTTSAPGSPICASPLAAMPPLQQAAYDNQPHPLSLTSAARPADNMTSGIPHIVTTTGHLDSDTGTEEGETSDAVMLPLKSPAEMEDEETADSNPAGTFIAFDEEERAMFDSVAPDWIKREGLLNRKLNKVAGGKVSNKGWKMLFVAGGSGLLVFYKEKASRARKSEKPTRPVSCFDLHGVQIEPASKQHTKKKHSLVLNAPSGEQMFLQAESDQSMAVWLELIRQEQRRAFTDVDSAIRSMVSDVRKRQMEFATSPRNRRRLRVKSFSSHGFLLNEGREEEKEKKPKARPWRSNSNSVQNPSGFPSSSGDVPQEDVSVDKQKVKSKLGRFFSSRPTVDSLKDKGILKQNLLFGGKLENAGGTVPSVVEKCIDVVDRKGLDSIGIYRLSGNAAAVQKLRFQLNHEEDVDLDDEPDINVITGTLKLYFRELADPLMTFAYYEPLIEAAKVGNYDDRLTAIKDLIHSLPPVNFATLKYLCEHLTRVASHSELNKMEASNLAIVFGPTLMRPVEETFKTVCNTGYQNSIIENLIQQCDWMFRRDA